MQNTNLPVFKMNEENIEVVKKYTYLGHILCDTWSDDLDIFRQRN